TPRETWTRCGGLLPPPCPPAPLCPPPDETRRSDDPEVRTLPRGGYEALRRHRLGHGAHQRHRRGRRDRRRGEAPRGRTTHRGPLREERPPRDPCRHRGGPSMIATEYELSDISLIDEIEDGGEMVFAVESDDISE